jgi:hypothetical protein
LSICEYARPTVPAANEDDVMLNAAGLMRSDSAAIAEAEALSLTLTVNVDDPTAVGVPEMVLPKRPSPAGNDPLATDQEYGGVPPVTFSVCE